MKTQKIHHDTFGEVVEDGGFEGEHLPSDDGVGQREADEEGLEGREAHVWWDAEAHGGDAKRSSSPLGDGVRDGLLHADRAVVPVDDMSKLHGEKRTKSSEV